MIIRTSNKKLNNSIRVLRYEIQGRKYQKIIKNLDCCEWCHMMGLCRRGYWGFQFYLRTKKGLVFLNRRSGHWFKVVCTSESFYKVHQPEFLPF